MSFNTTVFLNAEYAEKYKRSFETCPILSSRFVAWGEIEPLGLKELFDYQGISHTLGLDSKYCENAVRYFYANFSLTLKNKEIVGFKSYVKGKKISMNLQEFSDLMEIPLGGLDIFGCSAVRADFGFPEAAIQETLFLNKDTSLSVSAASSYRFPVRVANRILAFNLLNKAGNYDDIHDNVKAILTCLFRKTKIDWIKYILRTIARPNLRSLSYASQISNLLYLKDVPLGNWAFTTPAVNPINMGAINRMLVAGTIETLRELIFHDPPPADLVYTENVVKLLKQAKAQLEEFGKNVDHIPDYKVSSKRKLRKFLPSSSSAPPPPPPPPPPPSTPPPSQSIPEAPHSPPQPPVSREDRILDALAGMTIQQEKFASQQEKFAIYVHDGMSQLHEEHMSLAQKMDDMFAYHTAAYALKDTPPSPPPGFQFTWPPPSYYVAFPSVAHAHDAPGGSGDGAGPSGVGTSDQGNDGAGTSGAGPSSVGDDPMDQ